MLYEVITRLLFNRQFVDEHCRTDEHLLMLLMHEMHHLVLGHTSYNFV